MHQGKTSFMQNLKKHEANSMARRLGTTGNDPKKRKEKPMENRKEMRSRNETVQQEYCGRS